MIEAKGVCKKFDNDMVLKDISCKIPDGCIYGMVGTNGAGKSTFIRLINGVYKADGGGVYIDEQNVYENPFIKEQIAYVPDDLYFLNGASMDRMAKLYKSVYRFDEGRYARLVEAFKLDPKKNIAAFSKGMKRQAAIILALACKPKYMFFDETFDGLDPVMRNVVKSLICQDVAERKVTAVITSHSLRELEDICDQLALLHKGGLVLESDVSDLKTSLFKVQVAFAGDFDKSKFEGFDIKHFKKQASVASIIVKGDRDEVVSKIAAMNPIIMDVLPLTLEEVFTYEVESLGYEFSELLDGEV